MERRKKANTPLEQIFYNTQDIKQLEEAIAPFYNCSIDLSNDSVSVAVSNTNLPTDITKAYITDYNGNVYKFIAFNDDKTTAYIEYYASLKGADGRDAVDDIDDTITANNKLWSSQKTSTEITNATKIKVVYTTTDTPTISGSDYIFDKNNITPAIIDASIIGKELYQIVDDKIKYAYRVNTILNDDVYTSLVGEFGGGKQLYQHNIVYDRTAGGATAHYTIIEITDNATEINTRALFKQWLTDRGYNVLHPRNVNGGWYFAGSNTWYGADSLWVNNNNHIEIRYYNGASYSTNEDVSEVSVISDQVKPL